MTGSSIVVLDDDITQLQVYRRQLEKAGFNVIACSDAASAIDQISSSTAVIIVDLLLGYNTSIAFLHELQSDDEFAAIPVIVCSNIAETIPHDSLASYGVRRILDKTTMHPSDIIAAVRSVSS